jgi:uncharacterized protein (DUF4415 family)
MLAHRVSLAVLVCAAAGATSLRAQTSATAAWQATPASVLKSALRGTLAAQDRYRAAHAAYAPTTEALGLRLEPGVRVDILRATSQGWQARAVHQTQPGRSCVVFVGSLEGAEAPRTDGDHEMAGEMGIPLCDRMR